MKKFTYTIKDALGIHARPAGLLVKCAKNCSSKISISREDETVEAIKLIGIMGMAIKQGQTVMAEGENEEEDLPTVLEFFEENL